MKTAALVIFTFVLGFFVLAVGVGAGWYLHSVQPTPPPQVLFSTPQVIEIPVEVPVEVVRTVEVERIVTATPEPAATEPLALAPVVDCVDSARIEQQPISNVQGDAIKYGTIRRLTWIIENTGTCTWDGYTWESTADPLTLPVPYTEPGQRAVITHDILARDPLQLRMFLVPPLRSGLLGFGNVNTQDGGAIYIMEVWSKLTGGPGTYNQEVCGPSG